MALKRAIRHRNNSLFYKTPNGAQAGDIYMSLIHTCALGQVNPFEYLQALQFHVEEVQATPALWLPWNYREPPSRIDLGGLCASRGAATGTLQVIDDPADFAAVIAGSIVVVPHTNSRWTGVISQMSGIITVSGNELSHAAVTAREAAIPALVGCTNAMQRLRGNR